MAEQEVLLSPEGKQKLEDELNHLRLVRRKEVAERIKTAREFGDLAENAEYEDAKNEQAFVEGRIMTLENILRHAVVTQNGDVKSDVVTVGSTLTVRAVSYTHLDVYKRQTVSTAPERAGFDNGTYPQPKKITFGLNITF